MKNISKNKKLQNPLCRMNSSRYTVGVFSGLLFVFIFLLNLLTPYVADDWAYMISFYDQDWIDSITDIIPSMCSHAKFLNGRVISHGIVQLFYLFPNIVFKICNAAVFSAIILLIYRIANHGKKHNVLLLAGIFAGIWYYTPAFGQVALWRVGAVNYLWAVLFGLLFILPYVIRFTKLRDPMPHLWEKILFCFGALLFGMYTEIMSFIGVFLSVMLLLLSRLYNKDKLGTWLWIPTIIASVGYILLLSMPAELGAKGGIFSVSAIISRFVTETSLLKTYALPLLVLWAVLLILSLYAKVSVRKIILSVLFAVGALGAHYMLIMANFYYERCACFLITLMILACATLISELVYTKFAPVPACCGAIIAIVFVFSLVLGSYDIQQTYAAFSAREKIIAEKKAQGETELVLQTITPVTKYSAYYGLCDLNTEDTDAWPNGYIATYYKLDSILGFNITEQDSDENSEQNSDDK